MRGEERGIGRDDCGRRVRVGERSQGCLKRGDRKVRNVKAQGGKIRRERERERERERGREREVERERTRGE
jgi:hypothetical protein